MGLFLVLRKSVGKLTARSALSKQFLAPAQRDWSRGVDPAGVNVATPPDPTGSPDPGYNLKRPYIGSSSLRLPRAMKKMIRPMAMRTTIPIPIPTVHGVNGPSYFGGGGVGVGVGGGGGGGVAN